MFDMGFTELLLVGIVGLLVIGPERLPGTIRTTMVWVNRIRRSFNDVRTEVERELHNDAVMQELRDSATTLKQDVAAITKPVETQLHEVSDHFRERTDSSVDSLDRDQPLTNEPSSSTAQHPPPSGEKAH